MSVAVIASGAKVASLAFDSGKKMLSDMKMLADVSKGGSLVGYASTGMVEPSCFVDEDVRNSDLLNDTLQLAQSVYGAYYMRAFSMHNISIGNSSVAARLDKFSTHRSGIAGALESMANEEFDDRLIVDGDVRELPEDIQEIENTVRAQVEATGTSAALEAMAPYTVKGQQASGKNTPQSSHANSILKNAPAPAKATGSNTTFSKTVDINEPVNLGAGRMVNVTIKENDREVTIPVLIRMNAVYINTAPLLHILAAGGEDISFGARYKKWRLDGIDFWRDLVFCQDLIDAHKKNLRSDPSGIYLQMMQKRQKNTAAAIMSRSMSANDASNIVIMSQETATALEMKISGKLKDFNTRQKLFQQGYGMLMFIIDKQWGRIRMYTRDIPEFTELSERDLKASNKGGGVDIGDVLNSFRAGMSLRG